MTDIIYREDTGAYVVDGVCLPSPDDETIPEDIRAEYAERYTAAKEYAQEHPELIKIETPPVPPTEAEKLIIAKTAARLRIDHETSSAILAGFNYTVDPGTGTPEPLHFSYDSFDQQNFADTANMALLNLYATGTYTGKPTITTVTWNAYRNYNEDTGGELVRITLDAEKFRALYTEGALAHKAKQMEIGGLRKATVEAATTIEEVAAAEEIEAALSKYEYGGVE